MFQKHPYLNWLNIQLSGKINKKALPTLPKGGLFIASKYYMKHSQILMFFLSSPSKKKSEFSPIFNGKKLITTNPSALLRSWITVPSGGSGWAFLFILTGLLSCMEPSKTVENKNTQRDTIQTDFIFSETKDSVIKNGEYIKYYKNGVIEMRGMMKDGKRQGVWESWYEDGSPWSETTFKDGKKNGKTTTWYGNEQKRYEGFYANDLEAGKWTFWAENGKVQSTQNY